MRENFIFIHIHIRNDEMIRLFSEFHINTYDRVNKKRKNEKKENLSVILLVVNNIHVFMST